MGHVVRVYRGGAGSARVRVKSARGSGPATGETGTRKPATREMRMAGLGPGEKLRGD